MAPRRVIFHLWRSWSSILLLAAPASNWAVPGPALYGVIQTIEGQNFTGEIQFGPEILTITSTNVAHKVTVTQLASLRFQASPPLTPPVHGLRGTYFKTQNLDGPSVARIDPTLAFDWGDQNPHPEVGRDNFSVRWEGSVEAPVSGKYVFHTETDDGIRLWIGEKKIIERWQTQSVTEIKGEIDLEAGKRYNLKLEYFDGGGQAVCRLFWTLPGQARQIVPTERLFTAPAQASTPSPSPGEAHGLLGLYFNNTNLTGRFVAATNATIDFDWGTNPPRNGIAPDLFSVRWTGRIRAPQTAPYTFHLETDDGVRFWLNHVLLIDQWRDGTCAADSQPVPLVAGKEYPVCMEMYENRVNAKARLFWNAPNQPRALLPTQYLFPDAPPGSQPAITENSSGVLLRDGSFLALTVHSGDESTVRFSAAPADPAVAATDVAQIFFQSLPANLASRLEPGRRGLLLRNGDFVDGALREFKQNQIKLSSVLFGLKSYPRDQALVLALHDPVASSARFEIRARNGSRFLANDLMFEKDQIRLRSSPLAGWVVAAKDLVELRRCSP